jgi:hypothetical protein
LNIFYIQKNGLKQYNIYIYNTMATLSQVITKSLLNNLPAAAAKEFNLDEARVKEFLQTFLSTQLGKSGKSARAGPKGANGKGRVTGYLLFSNEHRQSVREEKPELKFTELGRELGRMWQALSESEKNEWMERAASVNSDNGLPPKTPAPVREKAGKRAAKSAPVETPAPVAAPAPAKKAAPAAKAPVRAAPQQVKTRVVKK